MDIVLVNFWYICHEFVFSSIQIVLQLASNPGYHSVRFPTDTLNINEVVLIMLRIWLMGNNPAGHRQGPADDKTNLLSFLGAF